MICLIGALILAGQVAALRESTVPETTTKTPPEANVRPINPVLPDYRIGPGDILQITVWKEPDASVPLAVVRSDGKISVPLLKDITAAGMTPSELERYLTNRLGKLIHDADVTVVVKEIHSEKIYLIGAVKREGPIPMQSSMTVLQAIAQAGGLSDYAKRSKIYVLRRSGSSQVILPFDYTSVIRGQRMEQNITLMPDDTIVIPQ